MINELLLSSSYGSYNIKIAKAMGITPAVYIGELLRQYDKNNSKTDTVYVDRKEVRERTTILKADQLEIDAKLIEAAIITKPAKNGNEIKIDFNRLCSIMSSENEETFTGLKELSTMTKKEIEEKKQETKKAGLVNSLIAYVNTSDVDLYNTYCRWINTIVESKNKKYLTKGIVLEAQEKINEATLLQNGKHDLNMAIDILEIATSFEFTNMEWAINKYRSKTSNFGNFMKQPTVLKSADSNQPWLDGSTIR